MHWSERIFIDPNICDGQPYLRGTRVRMGDLIRALAAGLSVAEICRKYTPLQPEDVHAARAYFIEKLRLVVQEFDDGA